MNPFGLEKIGEAGGNNEALNLFAQEEERMISVFEGEKKSVGEIFRRITTEVAETL